jgi:hypothetical protein
MAWDYAGTGRLLKIKSWTLLHPNAGSYFLGDEYGVTEVCQESGIRGLSPCHKDDSFSK